jgi:hypothetical protein
MKSTPYCINLTSDQLAEAGLTAEDVGRTISFTLNELPDGRYELENTEAEPAGEEETSAEGEGEGLDVAEKAVEAEDPQDSGVESTTSPSLDGQEDSPAGSDDELLGYTRPKKKGGPKVDMKAMRGNYRMN